jgi:hypothetical protein
LGQAVTERVEAIEQVIADVGDDLAASGSTVSKRVETIAQVIEDVGNDLAH